MTYRLGLTALGRRATISRRSKKDPRLAVGAVIDVHSDFIHTVLEWLGDGNQEIKVNGVTKYIISKKDIEQ